MPERHGKDKYQITNVHIPGTAGKSKSLDDLKMDDMSLDDMNLDKEKHDGHGQ